MKRILFILMSGGMLLASCAEKDTKIDIETQTSIIYGIFGEDDNQAYTEEVPWTSEDLEYVDITFNVVLVGYDQTEDVRFRLVQTNAPATPSLQVMEAGVSFVDFSDNVYTLPAGQKSVPVTVRILKDQPRLDENYSPTTVNVFTLNVGLQLAEEYENLRLAATTLSISAYRNY